MKFFIPVTILVVAYIHGLAGEELQYTDCGSHSTLSSAVLTPTERDPNGAYLVREGQSYSLKVQFQAAETFQSAEFHAVGILPHNQQQFDLAQDSNPCQGAGGLHCPLHPGPMYSYTATTTVNGLSAEIRTFGIQVRLFDPASQRNIFCLVFPGHALV